MNAESSPEVRVPVITRTLIAAGFTVVDLRRMPSHGEFICSREDFLGRQIPYIVAVFDQPGDNADEIARLALQAHEERRILVAVTYEPSPESLSWGEFAEILGGEVPSWMALSKEYDEIVMVAGKNELPSGFSGEAWRVFEEAVADGLEFMLGRRVKRLGGAQRGKRVGDVLARTPDDRLLVIDAKASKEPFALGAAALRPLAEYAIVQKRRQVGSVPLGAVVVVANEFGQPEEQILTFCQEFNSETGVPLACLTTGQLVSLKNEISGHVHLRNRIRWSVILCRDGLIREDVLLSELKNAVEFSYAR